MRLRTVSRPGGRRVRATDGVDLGALLHQLNTVAEATDEPFVASLLVREPGCAPQRHESVAPADE
jgi:hypothetical protein